MKRFVYNEKYAKLMVKMSQKEHQIDELAKAVDANSGHLRNVLDQWQKEKVIHKSRSGREYNIKLTDKGKAMANKLAEVMDIDNNYQFKQENKEVQNATKQSE